MLVALTTDDVKRPMRRKWIWIVVNYLPKDLRKVEDSHMIGYFNDLSIVAHRPGQQYSCKVEVIIHSVLQHLVHFEAPGE